MHFLVRFPFTNVAWLTLILMRILGAAYNPIMDCDETFNYWEPLHYFVTGGPSFQTWEYAPSFALRSWVYLLPYAGIAQIALHLGLNKVSGISVDRCIKIFHLMSKSLPQRIFNCN
jgi:alpha-1,2-mannosyltransferase